MIILGIDLGLARTGIAISDSTGFLASPVKTINQKNENELIKEISQIVQQKNVKKIVLGLPKNMDGSLGERAIHSQEFAKKLQTQTNTQVIFWDERLTTVSATKILNETNTRGKKRKQVLDTVAATIILQDYLNSIS